MTDLPSWDEIERRLMDISPQVAVTVIDGLDGQRDDADKRIVLDIIDTIEREPVRKGAIN